MKSKTMTKALALALAAAVTLTANPWVGTQVYAAEEVQTVDQVEDETGAYTSAPGTITTISSMSQFKQFVSDVNSGSDYTGKTVRLATDLYFDATESMNFTPVSYFTGTFDGCGHKIDGLTASSGYVGVFRHLKGATVSNLKVTNLNITGAYGCGGIIYVAENSTITDCSVTGSITGAAIGGIVGEASDSTQILNCSNAATFTVSERSYGVGGIATSIEGKSTIANCYNVGAIKVNSNIDYIYYGGGIVGQAKNSVITNCYNAGSMDAVASGYGEGVLVGNLSTGAVLENSYYKEGILSSEAAVGHNNGGLSSNVKIYTAAQMKSATATLNSNSSKYAAWRKWVATSTYPTFATIYEVTYSGVTGGTVLSDLSYACAGDTVTLSCTPNANYKLSSITVKNAANGSSIKVSGSGNIRTFVMPSQKVVVTAKFITSQTIRATSSGAKSLSKTYGDKAFSLGSQVTKGDGKLSYSSSNTAVATVDATTGKVTIKGAGNTNIVVTAAGTANYLRTAVTVNLKVGQKASAIRATSNGKTSLTKVYGTKAFKLGSKLTAGNGALTYVSSNKKVATINAKNGTVTIKGAGKAVFTITAAATTNYKKATAKVTLTVKPQKAVLKTVSSKAKNKMTVTWKKDATVSGYQIQYSLTKNFKSGNQTVNVASASTVTKTISGLKSKKTYYVRVRAYKTISGKKVYGDYSSSVKKVKVK